MAQNLRIQIPDRPIKSKGSPSEFDWVDYIDDSYNSPANSFRPINTPNPNTFSSTGLNQRTLDENMRRSLTPKNSYSPKITADKLTDKIVRIIRFSPNEFKANELYRDFEDLNDRDRVTVITQLRFHVNNNPIVMEEYNKLKRSVMLTNPEFGFGNKGGKISRKRKRQTRRNTFKKNKGKYSKKRDRSRKYYKR